MEAFPRMQQCDPESCWQDRWAVESKLPVRGIPSSQEWAYFKSCNTQSLAWNSLLEAEPWRECGNGSESLLAGNWSILTASDWEVHFHAVMFLSSFSVYFQEGLTTLVPPSFFGLIFPTRQGFIFWAKSHFNTQLSLPPNYWQIYGFQISFDITKFTILGICLMHLIN